MPTNEHLVLCGGAGGPPRSNATRLNLNLHGASANVRLEDRGYQPAAVGKYFGCPCRLVGNSQLHLRSGQRDLAWRQYRLAAGCNVAAKISVCDSGTSAQICGLPILLPSALVETISFLSDDDYEFEFRLLEKPPPVEGYFAFSGDRRCEVHT